MSVHPPTRRAELLELLCGLYQGESTPEVGRALDLLAEWPSADGLWAGLHVLLDHLELRNADPQLAADALMLAVDWRQCPESAADMLLASGWDGPEQGPDPEYVDEWAGRARARRFERLTRRLAEQEMIAVLALPFDADAADVATETRAFTDGWPLVRNGGAR